MAKFIVTGGAGFIGSNVVHALNDRGETDILVVDDLNSPLKERHLSRLKYSDYLDKRELRPALRNGQFANATAIFHLGACSSTTEKNADYLADNNTAYTRELAEWCLDGGRRFVYASSASTYGAGECGYSDDESVIPHLKPLNLYGQSKQAFDLIALEKGWFSQIVGLKFFNVFGPNEDHKGSMRSMIHQAYGQILQSGRIRLFKSYHPDYPDGGQLRDFVYVKDVVAEILYFHDNPSKNGIFNCGTGKARSWLDLGNAVFRAMDRMPNIEFIEMPEQLRAHYQYFTEADMSKTRAAGFNHAFLPLEDAVADYVRNHLVNE
jgi:ADP-L-glycero-D-manno-heptose 6-epimerase